MNSGLNLQEHYNCCISAHQINVPAMSPWVWCVWMQSSDSLSSCTGSRARDVQVDRKHLTPTSRQHRGPNTRPSPPPATPQPLAPCLLGKGKNWVLEAPLESESSVTGATWTHRDKNDCGPITDLTRCNTWYKVVEWVELFWVLFFLPAWV